MGTSFVKDENPLAEVADKLAKAKPFVGSWKVAAAGDIHIEGFDVPLRIEVISLRDAATGMYRKFSMKIVAPKGMKARLTRAMDPNKPGRIILPPKKEITDG